MENTDQNRNIKDKELEQLAKEAKLQMKSILNRSLIRLKKIKDSLTLLKKNDQQKQP